MLFELIYHSACTLAKTNCAPGGPVACSLCSPVYVCLCVCVCVCVVCLCGIEYGRKFYFVDLGLVHARLPIVAYTPHVQSRVYTARESCWIPAREGVYVPVISCNIRAVSSDCAAGGTNTLTHTYTHLHARTHAHSLSLTRSRARAHTHTHTGMTALAEALKYNSSLTYLDVHACGIHDSGATALARALQDNCTLAVLNLKANYM